MPVNSELAAKLAKQQAKADGEASTDGEVFLTPSDAPVPRVSSCSAPGEMQVPRTSSASRAESRHGSRPGSSEPLSARGENPRSQCKIDPSLLQRLSERRERADNTDGSVQPMLLGRSPRPGSEEVSANLRAGRVSAASDSHDKTPSHVDPALLERLKARREKADQDEGGDRLVQASLRDKRSKPPPLAIADSVLQERLAQQRAKADEAEEESEDEMEPEVEGDKSVCRATNLDVCKSTNVDVDIKVEGAEQAPVCGGSLWRVLQGYLCRKEETQAVHTTLVP